MRFRSTFNAQNMDIKSMKPGLYDLRRILILYKDYKDSFPMLFNNNYSMDIVLYFRKFSQFHLNTLTLYRPSNDQNMGNKINEMLKTWLKMDFSCIQGLHRFYNNIMILQLFREHSQYLPGSHTNTSGQAWAKLILKPSLTQKGNVSYRLFL